MNRYSLNPDFFTEWSPQMAYVLGFIAADGCVTANGVSWRLQIGLAAADRAHLELIRDLMGSNAPIVNKDNNKGHACSFLTIHSKSLCESLMCLGVEPRKSCTMSWPEVPREFEHHFARGYIDGDGHIRTFANSSSKHLQMTVEVAGTRVFLQGLKDAFNRERDRPTGSIKKLSKSSEAMGQLVFNGTKSPLAFGEWLYRDSTPEIRMVRKWDVYDAYSREWGFLQGVGHNSRNPARGSQNARTKLTWEIVRDIRGRYVPGTDMSARLAEEYRINRQTIYQIVNGKTWVETLPNAV